MAFQLSPGVLTTEVDLTTIIPAVSTSNGGFVGNFVWGPADLRILIDSEVTLVNRFGKPDSNTFTSFFTAANFLAYANNLRVVRSVGANANNATASGTGIQIKNEDVWENAYSSGAVTTYGNYAARYPGALGNSLRVSTCSSANAFSQNLSSAYGVTANVVNGSNVVTFSGNVSSNLVIGDILTVDDYGDVIVSNVTANGLVATVNTAALYTSTSNGNVVTRTWAYASYFNGAPGTSTYAATVGGTNDEIHAVVVDEDGLFSTGVGGQGTVLEVYPYMSKALDSKTSDGAGNYIRDVIYNNSKYIIKMSNPAGTNWGNTAAGTTFTNLNYAYYASLSGGSDDQPTDGNLETSWDLFANADEVDISLLLAGNASTTVGTYIIQSIAETRKDCVAFVSPKLTDVVQQAGNETTNINTTRNAYPSSSYAVMDSGWKYTFDKYNNIYRWIPLNGDIAGLCVNTDTVRDPWWSPAGFNRGQIKNAVKLAWNPNKTARDTIYPIGVNPVVAFPGEGTVLYGDKTLQTKPSAFDRINVRRLFIVLEKAIARAAKYSLFEFNDVFTRAQFVSLVEPFLRDVQSRRGIYDFRVVCDETNNTPEVIDGNRFVGDIYIKPARSINFIQLNFVAVRTGVDFTEIVGKF